MFIRLCNLFLALLLATGPAFADAITLPYSYSPGQVITAAKLNANNQAITDQVNGNLSDANIKVGAAIAPTKIDLTQGLAILRAAAANGLTVGTTGDTVPRLAITSEGAIHFGPGGSTARDIQIMRKTGPVIAIRNEADSADGNITAGALTLSTALPGTSGGTGNTAAPGTGKMLVSDGTKYAQVGPGTNKQIPRSDGTTIAMVTPDYVDGPASSTDHRLAVFNGTTGKLLKDGPSNGTAGWVLTSNGTSAVPTFQAAGTSVFTSSDQTITGAGSLTLAHGLGTTPKNVWAALVCQTAELNYSVGNVVPLVGGNQPFAVSSSCGYGCVVDATNLNIRYGSSVGPGPFYLLDKTTGTATAITLANWKARFYAQ